MASDLSSGCTDDIDIFEEREEGELSLEDVSSSEESHPNYRPNFRNDGRCPTCMSQQICASWCIAARVAQKTHRKQDAAHGKENRRHGKEPSGAVPKQMVATLQEKNEDLVSISSDSDMEIVGLPGNSKQLHARSKSVKVRKKKKKKRSHSSVVRIDDALESPMQVETYLVDVPVVKKVRSTRLHHREESPPRYSVRSPVHRPLGRSPSSRRYRATRSVKSPRSPPRRSRSPQATRLGLGERRSSPPRKMRSPRRSPVKPSSTFRERTPPSSQAYVHVYDAKLLKKVRRLESVGAGSTKDLPRSKEHSSLREKLSNMLRNKSEEAGSNEKATSRKKRSETNVVTIDNNNHNDNNGNGSAAAPAESDDEENLEVLRRLALETKPKKVENKVEEPKPKSESAHAEESDDNDIEANELRILALKSAIMKKYEKRVTRGVKSKKPARYDTRVESPFSESFLEDIHIPGGEEEEEQEEQENSSVKSLTARSSPILDDENNHAEDMDLDTDVEREKEKDFMPYSPTDDLTREFVVEVELPVTIDNDDNNEEEIIMLGEVNAKAQKGKGQPPTSPERPNYMAGVDTPYSPSAPTETPNLRKLATRRLLENRTEEIDLENMEKTCASGSASSPYYRPGVDTPYSPCRSREIPRTENISLRDTNTTITDSPYSPTDTPLLDPELFPIFPNLPVVPQEIERIGCGASEEESAPKVEVTVQNLAATTPDETINSQGETRDDSSIGLQQAQEEEKITESPKTVADVSVVTAQPDESFKPIDTMDKLPEVDLDGSPLVPVSKELEGAELFIPIESSTGILDIANEPLYLRCLSEVARDTNKIPTLVNRTLVPALILKTNKQLQQPLPQKKADNHTEPSFKSAEMRPVSVETEPVKPTTLFKPIKLCPIAKKPQVMTTAAAAFNMSFGEDSAKETKSVDESAIAVETPSVAKDTKTPSTPTVASGKTQSVDEQSELKKRSSAKNRKRREKLRDKRQKAAEAGESPNLANQSSSNDRTAKSGEPNSRSSLKKKNMPEVGGASKDDEAAKRAEIKSMLVKSWENFKENVLKEPAGKSAEGKGTPGKSNKAIVTKKGTASGESEKKKKTRRSKKKVKRLSSSSTVTTGKSSDLDVTMSIEQTDDKPRDKEEMETKKSEGDSKRETEESRSAKEAEKKRRCSMDEDEEALRALLLASLPKRTKPVEASLSTQSTNPSSTKIPQSSEAKVVMNVEKPASNAASEPNASSADSALTNPTAPSSQSLNAIPASQAKVEGLAATTKHPEAAGEIIARVSKSSGLESSKSSGLESSPRKRANSVVVKGPPKKIVKKALPALASTKVVNNAKKYQNALLQKKLNLQRAAMNYGAQNGSRNITLNNLKINDAARPSSPKISTASKMQRLVINLSADTDSEAESEGQPSNSNNSDTQTEVRKPLAIPTTDFEKSVELFLKDQRKKLESLTVSKTPASSTTTINKTLANSVAPATGKLSGHYNTPLAVRRHLPMSQQEEYRRLKQQIMERERQKLQKTIENGSLNPSLKSPCTPPGPLSPASPIAAAQKSQIVQRVAVAATHAATNVPAPLTKDQVPDKSVLHKKVELARSNENRPAGNVTKVSKTVAPAIPNKQLTKPLASSSLVNSNIPNNPSNASTPKAPVRALPKANSAVSNANTPANTSTPKAQSLITSKPHSSISSRASLPLAKGAASSTENRGVFVAEVPCASTKFPVESSSASVSSRNEARRSLAAISVTSLPAISSTSAGSRSSLNPTEMLTIQIPNDKVQTAERTASTGVSKGESSSPPNGRSVGMLKILTKEQLNSRFVQIQVKQGSAGRTVTVGGSPRSRDDAARSASSSPVPKVLPEGRSDKFEKTMSCDSSLIVNESTATRRGGERRPGESMIGNSEDSTLVLSRIEGNTRNDRTTADFSNSTVLLARDNPHNDTTVDSTASTIVFVHDSEYRESPGTVARNEEREDGTNARAAKQTKGQVKEAWETIRADVKNELDILTALPIDQQRIILMESQENLVAKRNMVLDDLTEMSGCLRQWEVEREIQTKLIAEVRRLREQLRTAEKRLHEQRAEMNSMGPKVTKAHEKINHGRRDCYKLSRICHGLGTKIMGEDYKVPDTGAQLLNERLKEVAVHTRQLSKKKVPPIGSPSDSRDTNSPGSSTGSDTVSESSFVERPSNSTTPLPENSNMEDKTNSLTVESDLDDTRVLREDSEPSEMSVAESPCPNPTCEIEEVVCEEKVVESSEAKEEAQTIVKEGSSSSEMNAQTVERVESNSSEINAQTKEKEASSSSECNTNNVSEIPTAKSISEDRFEDTISMPGTSKSDSHRQLISSDEQPPPLKSKVDPYKSVLTHMKSSRSVNPDGILCPYELMGTCSDGDCQFCHLDPGHCQ